MRNHALVLGSIAAVLVLCSLPSCGSSSSGNSAGVDGGIDVVGDGGPNAATPIGPCTDPDCVLPNAPVLPVLTNVVGGLREDSVGVDFDPVDGALDYRIYPLPAGSDVSANADGSITVKNAVYRCAGLRQTFDVANNTTSDGGLTPQSSDGSGLMTYDGNGYAWKTKVLPNPTLGYVYVTPANDRVAVYSLSGITMDNELGWNEARIKNYVTDPAARQALIAKGWRDDGIAFYAPATASATTDTIYGSQMSAPEAGKTFTQYFQYYFGSADQASHATDTIPPAAAFQVLKTAGSDTQPLMAVEYDENTNQHTELAVGKERYNRAANQGPGALWHVEWAGITQPTILVVEALASGCPYQGFLSPNHLDAAPHQTFLTLAEIQKASSTGEAFINGEFDGPVAPPPGTVAPGGNALPTGDVALPILHTATMSPKAIARSFIRVKPQPHNAADWDWYQGFTVGTDLGTQTKLPQAGALCPPGAFAPTCGRWQTNDWDISAYNIDAAADGTTSVLTYGVFQGQLWDAFDDVGSDVTGKIRFTARQMANVDSDPTKFLHATMSVDIVSTDRRYPQLIISDQPAPVQEGFLNANGNELLFQAIQGPATRIEMQAIHGLVNGRSWDINNQAPEHILVRTDFGDLPQAVTASDQAIQDHMGVDRLTRFDVYVSSERAYFFLDGQPAACSKYPAGFALGGQVSVTFGDVLYHEGANDETVCAYQKPYPFLHEHQCTETKRHFDDVAFKSAAGAPAWDETILPCNAY